MKPNPAILPWREGSGRQTIQYIQVLPTPRLSVAAERGETLVTQMVGRNHRRGLLKTGSQSVIQMKIQKPLAGKRLRTVLKQS